MANEGIIRVSPLTKTRLKQIKQADKTAGMKTTIIGIVDRLVENEFENRQKKTM